MNGKRTRGRPNRNRPSNSRNQNFDSNGPEGRVRGSASQVFEKYLTLARDAQSSGDRIAAENYFQHAEHYYRILNVNAQNDRDRAQSNGSGQRGAVNGQRSGQSTGQTSGSSPAGAVEPVAAKPQPDLQPPPQQQSSFQRPRSEQPRTQPTSEVEEKETKTPKTKPAHSPKRASQSDTSPDATSAETAKS